MITVRWMEARYDSHRIEIDESELTPTVSDAIIAFKQGNREQLDALIDEWQSDETLVKASRRITAGIGVYGERPEPGDIVDVQVED